MALEACKQRKCQASSKDGYLLKLSTTSCACQVHAFHLKLSGPLISPLTMPGDESLCFAMAPLKS